ncbi:MAG: hypothetical protein JW866_07910, partial [Ignavibacteriales bacterium]|nr:hypothetical protein [Ignavibacteriales bacterium]
CPEDLQKIVIEDINRNCLWIGSRSGLLKFKNLQWTQFIGEEYYLHSNIISTIKLDKTNNLWIGTLKGLVKFDGTSWYDFSPNIGNSIVSSIDFDSQGNAWIATRNGLYKFNGVNWTHFHRGNSRLSSNYLSCVAVDNNDVIWIGTETWGLWTYYNNTFDSLSGYLFSSISCLEITQDNRIFVGHYMSSMSGTYGGISIYDGNNWTSYYDNITRPAISDIAVSTKNNNIWAATTKGLLLIDNKNQKTFFRIDNSGLPSDKTNSVIIDKDDNLWITTSDKGLTKFRKGDLLKIGY